MLSDRRKLYTVPMSVDEEFLQHLDHVKQLPDIQKSLNVNSDDIYKALPALNEPHFSYKHLTVVVFATGSEDRVFTFRIVKIRII